MRLERWFQTMKASRTLEAPWREGTRSADCNAQPLLFRAASSARAHSGAEEVDTFFEHFDSGKAGPLERLRGARGASEGGRASSCLGCKVSAPCCAESGRRLVEK